jgi:hypothetical protein
MDLKNDRNHSKRLVFHSGKLRGINSFIGFLPHYNIGIIILANESTRIPFSYGIDFWELMQSL